MKKKEKIIGTFVPLTALQSEQQLKEDQGTFETGFLFLDWLKKTHQSAWQVLPLHETQLEDGSTTKHVPSPYKSYGIGISPQYLSAHFSKFLPTQEEKEIFLSENKDWLEDYVLFCSLRDHFGTDDWRKWDGDIRIRKKEAISSWNKKLATEIDRHIVLQWQLHQSYKQLQEKAKELGIALIGDLPFYPSVQSPLVWAWQNIFQLEEDGRMQFVSGIPNTLTTHFGRQVWGHPLFNWSQQKEVLSFWEVRIRYFAKLFTFIRFDHAKAFFYYGTIDLTDPRKDTYLPGPGKSVFSEIITFAHEQGLTIFAEDSGDNVEELRKALEELQIPGIKILRFGLEKLNPMVTNSYAEVSSYPKNSVAYTTTHDTRTLLGHLHTLTTQQKKILASAANVEYSADDKVLTVRLRDAVVQSPSDMVIIPIQDWLLTTDRINIPGTEVPVNDPNWRFRLKIPVEKLPTDIAD